MMKKDKLAALVCGGFSLFGATFSAGLTYALDFDLFPCIALRIGRDAGLPTYGMFVAGFLFRLLLVYLSSFTLFACPVSALICFYSGSVMGTLTVKYCFSSLHPFTHGAILFLLLCIGGIYTLMGRQALLGREALRTAAPDPVFLLHCPSTRCISESFLRLSAVTAASVTALFLLMKYFPVL